MYANSTILFWLTYHRNHIGPLFEFTHSTMSLQLKIVPKMRLLSDILLKIDWVCKDNLIATITDLLELKEKNSILRLFLRGRPQNVEHSWNGVMRNTKIDTLTHGLQWASTVTVHLSVRVWSTQNDRKSIQGIKFTENTFNLLILWSYILNSSSFLLKPNWSFIVKFGVCVNSSRRLPSTFDRTLNVQSYDRIGALKALVITFVAHCSNICTNKGRPSNIEFSWTFHLNYFYCVYWVRKWFVKFAPDETCR